MLPNIIEMKTFHTDDVTDTRTCLSEINWKQNELID